MRKFFFFLLTFLSIVSVAIRFGVNPMIKNLGFAERAGLRVDSTVLSKVFIDSKEVGTTPFQDESLNVGEYLIRLEPQVSESSKHLSWQGYVKLNGGTLSVVNRQLAKNITSSSGEVITLEKGNGITVISTPPQAEVIVDGKGYGRTPITITDLAEGEHQFFINREGFLKRSIRIKLVAGYNIILSTDLAIAEADLTQITTVPITKTSKIKIQDTPTGFLRVRNQPSLQGQEIARVDSGDILTLLEELPSWVRVRLQNNLEGYVASAYIEKID